MRGQGRRVQLRPAGTGENYNPTGTAFSRRNRRGPASPGLTDYSQVDIRVNPGRAHNLGGGFREMEAHNLNTFGVGGRVLANQLLDLQLLGREEERDVVLRRLPYRLLLCPYQLLL